MDFVSPEITASASSIPTVQKFNELSVASGTTQFRANKDGVFIGGDSYANAPWAVDYTGKQYVGLQSGSQVIIDGPNGVINFGYTNQEYGNISVDSSLNMLYVANNYHAFWDQDDNYIGKLFYDSPTSYGLELNGGADIQFTTGTTITDTGAYLYLDRTLIVNGDVALSAGKKFQVGNTGGATFSSGNVGGHFEMNAVGGIITYWQKF